MEDKKKEIKETIELLETYKREIEEALGGAPDLDVLLTMNGKMKLLDIAIDSVKTRLTALMVAQNMVKSVKAELFADNSEVE